MTKCLYEIIKSIHGELFCRNPVANIGSYMYDKFDIRSIFGALVGTNMIAGPGVDIIADMHNFGGGPML